MLMAPMMLMINKRNGKWSGRITGDRVAGRMKSICCWRLLLSAAVCLCTISGCSENERDKGEPEFLEMKQLREELKQKLGADYDLPVLSATAEQLERGKNLYQTICSHCHGDLGKPPPLTLTSLTIPPADLSSPELVRFFSEQARLEIIRNGISGTPMKGLKGLLNEKDTVAVFMYTRTLIK